MKWTFRYLTLGEAFFPTLTSGDARFVFFNKCGRCASFRKMCWGASGTARSDSCQPRHQVMHASFFRQVWEARVFPKNVSGAHQVLNGPKLLKSESPNVSSRFCGRRPQNARAAARASARCSASVLWTSAAKSGTNIR